VCKVRVAQCVHIAQSGSRSQTSIEQAPFFVLGCEAPAVPGAFGVWVFLEVYMGLLCVCEPHTGTIERRGGGGGCEQGGWRGGVGPRPRFSKL
jgi:hypothetical protein